MDQKGAHVMKTNIILFAIIALLTYSATIYFDSRQPPVIAQPEQPSEALAGKKVPAFAFKTPDGKTHDITDFKGRIVLLNFWASWCPPCVLEFPKLLEIAAENPDDVTIIALSSDIDETAMNVFLEKQPPRENNILIALDTDQSITQKLFQTYKLPETILIDPEQLMRDKIAGGDWKKKFLQQKIDALRNKKS
jgi:thiol-disulfide isomerase/thioredoxin